MLEGNERTEKIVEQDSRPEGCNFGTGSNVGHTKKADRQKLVIDAIKVSCHCGVASFWNSRDNVWRFSSEFQSIYSTEAKGDPGSLI